MISRSKYSCRIRILRILAIVLLGAVVVLELVARFGLGLGDPPLFEADERIEYLAKPGKYRRFHNDVVYNQYGMRSDPFGKTKDDPAEMRVMFIGDSVINGGTLTDHRDLATQTLKRELADALSTTLVVGNISAGSWGPPNQLAYLQRFGFFEADLLVVVISSHDHVDVPTYEPAVDVEAALPSRSPWLAISEIPRYLPRILSLGKPFSLPPRPKVELAKAGRSSMAALRQMVQMAHAEGASVIVGLHLEKSELGVGPKLPGYHQIRVFLADLPVESVELGPAFEDALGQGRNPYRDQIHPNPLGQHLIARTLFEPIRLRLAKPESGP